MRTVEGKRVKAKEWNNKTGRKITSPIQKVEKKKESKNLF